MSGKKGITCDNCYFHGPRRRWKTLRLSGSGGGSSNSTFCNSRCMVEYVVRVYGAPGPGSIPDFKATRKAIKNGRWPHASAKVVE